MRILFVRHGIAEDPALDRPDYARALTEPGIQRMRLQARALQRGGFEIDRLFTSPLVRSQQTARILGEALGLDPEEDQLLAPGCRVGDLHELLRRVPEARRVMVVGHQPDLGEIVRVLNGAHVERDVLTGASVRMRKGMVADIELTRRDAPVGMLRGLYDPEVLAGLGV